MKSLLLTAIVLLLTPFASAQEPSLKPSMSAPKAEPPTLLSLEIQYNPTLPPAYISVRGTETKPRWIWVTRFAPAGPVNKDELPIQSVRIESQFNGETADVTVSLFRGREGFEREDHVGTYHIGLDEKTTVTELKSFGVKPFDLRLLNVLPPLPPPPTIENRTLSVGVINVEQVNVPLPTYKLTVRNHSEKKIRSIRIEVNSDGRPHLSVLWHDEFDKPIIDVGGVGEKSLQVVIPQKTAVAYEPGAAVSNNIIIRTVVFDDLTFDGEPEAACQYEMMLVGRRVWLGSVLPLIESELTNEAVSPQEFKEKLTALTFKTDDTEARKSVVSATCLRPDSFVNLGTRSLTLELVRDLDRLINTRPAPPVNFRAWLESRRDDYKPWLARLH
jgi:hypothetical protein